MAAAALGLTKYGMNVQYSTGDDETITRSYNGLNFSSDESSDKAAQLAYFITGEYIDNDDVRTSAMYSFAGIVRALNNTVDTYEVTQRNTVSWSA